MRRALALLVFLVGLASGCKESYRIGEYVMVEWEGRDYPAYIIDKRGTARFRVHYDGYDSRWDEDVTIDRIKGKITGPVTPPPPPEKVARVTAGPKASGSPATAQNYKQGDRVRVKWRNSLYVATIVAVVAPDRYLVHYEGYEAAWDETVPSDRIAGR